MDFFSILALSWDPSCGHVGHIFLQNGAPLWSAAPLFAGFMLFFDFLVVLAPSWPNLGSILEGLGLYFGGLGGPFWRFLVTICPLFKTYIGALRCWACGVTRSAKNLYISDFVFDFIVIVCLIVFIKMLKTRLTKQIYVIKSVKGK